MNNQLYKLLEGHCIDGKYRLKKLIAVDMMDICSVTFLADELLNNEPIRQINLSIGSKEDLKDDWRSNAESSLNTDCPFIAHFCSISEWNHSDAIFYCIVSEAPQVSLKRHLQQEGIIAHDEVKQIITSVANALVYLHAKNLTHGDTRPSRIVRFDDVWKLTDSKINRILWGGSKYLLTHECIFSYSAPEMQNDLLIPTKQDIWSLGITIVEMLTGKLPYPPSAITDLRELISIIQNGNPSIPDLPAPFDAIAKGCLTKDYEQRWTAHDVLKALE
jgi:serine/threonine protein kinase